MQYILLLVTTVDLCFSVILIATCARADGLFAYDVSQQVILVETRAIWSHGHGLLIIRSPDVDHLVVGVSI